MGSWVRSITSPFKKACTVLNPPTEKKSKKGKDSHCMKLQGEVMACTYEDVQVMWSILDKSKPADHRRSCS